MNLVYISIEPLLKQYSIKPRKRNHPMKHIPLTTLAVLVAPFSAHAGEITVPEPGLLPLLGIGIAAAVAVKFFRKK